MFVVADLHYCIEALNLLSCFVEYKPVDDENLGAMEALRRIAALEQQEGQTVEGEN